MAMFDRIAWRAIGVIGFGFFIGSLEASAQEPKPVRVRGTIERVEGATYVIKTRDGSEVKVQLTEKPLIVAIQKASLSDVKPGSYIGSAGMPQADGSQRAIEVHIFPEAMRGTGDGHYGWDLVTSSTMTNGNVEQSAVGTDGQTLIVKYKDGEKKVFVTPETQIVIYMPGEASELKPGAKIFVGAAKPQADGTLQTPRINVGRDGITPPM
jgi:hypothetical protein